MKALVTGAAGFIGSHVVRALLARGASVVAFDRPGADGRNLAGLPASVVHGDVRRADDVRAALRGVTHVFHLAAVFSLDPRDAAKMMDVNVLGTENVLARARELGGCRVVHTSSIARFGGQGLDRRATEESPFRLGPTLDAYSWSKHEAHEVALAAARRGQDVVLTAPCGPLGPGDVGPTPTGRLLLAALAMPISALPHTVTTFADVRDMAEAHVLAAERGQTGESYLLGHEDWGTLDLARAAQRARGRSRPVVRVPLAAASAAAWALAAWTARSGEPPLFTPESIRISRLGLRADCTKSTRALGVRYRPVARALEDALDWFDREGYTARAITKRSRIARTAPPSDMNTASPTSA